MSLAADRLARAAAVVLLIIFAAQCVLSMRLKSATFDEPTYLSAGYVALTTTGVDLNPAHPPLMKYLLAAPLFFMPVLAAEAVPHWQEAIRKPRTYGASFLFENRADPDAMLFAARASVVAVAVLLGALVWCWARQLYGPEAAIVALGLYAFCPNIIAHSTLATLDLGVTAGVAAAQYALWRAYRLPTLRAGAWAGAALAVALLMKATALILVALLPLQLAAAVAWHRLPAHPDVRARPARRQTAAPPSAALPLVRTTLIALLVAAVVVSVGYGFHRFGLAEYVASFRHGVLNRAAFMNTGYEAFCWGWYSATGFAWYFLAAFILKTPLPTLLLAIAAVAWLAARRPRHLFDELFLILPIVAFFVATSQVRDNLGLRYVLPIYPLLYVLIGGMAAAAWRRIGGDARGRRRATTGAALVGACYLAGAAWIYPNYLSYFNGLFCGPANGIRYLDDSNIDWGQGFKQLAHHLHAHDIPEVKGLYFPLHLAPYVIKYYGVPFTQLTFDEVRNPGPGWYAISAHLLQRPSLTTDPAHRDLRFDWLDRFTPVARIGYSIYLYHFE